MRISGDRMAARAGVTLLAVMLAGAMTVIAVLAMLEGVIVAIKITHENAEALRADGNAFDVVWGRFNKPYGELNNDNVTTNDYGATNINSSILEITYTYTNQVNGEEHSLSIRRSNIPEERSFTIKDD